MDIIGLEKIVNKMEYGLIGKNLIHSYSCLIHSHFDYKYELRNLDEEDLNIFFKQKCFKGINVTIPYKKSVIKYLDYIDDKALRIGAINTIKNEDGILKGYNTDYNGFEYLLKKNDINIEGKECLVLGDGGASKAITEVLLDKHAKKIYIATRKNNNIVNTDKIGYISYYKIKELLGINILINCTNVGMYPNISDEININLDDYIKISTVIDIIYNPERTILLQKASEKGIGAINGLDMLIYQAMKSYEIFKNIKIDNEDRLFNEIKNSMDNRNIVLIGMSGCGKTEYGKKLSISLNRRVIDTDEEIVKLENMSIKKIFECNGEEYFRNIERNVIKKVSLLSNCIISTGGGVVLDENNIRALKANGKIIFINNDINSIISHLKFDGSRPLIKSVQDVTEIYNKRLKLYKKYSDESKSL